METIQLPSKKFKARATMFSVTCIIVCLLCWYVNFDPSLFFSDFHFMRELLGEMSKPNFTIVWDGGSLITSILQTLSMSFLGTLYGGIAATVFAFLAANNIMPVKAVRSVAKLLLTLLRVIPSLVVILIFVIAAGPGLFAGVLTLTVTTFGTFGKLLTEVLENAGPGPSEAIFSVGASRMQVIRFCILPQVVPAFISNLFYAFDLNVRLAIGLGIFGGGGIGYNLYMAMRVLRYKDAAALILCVIFLVLVVENVSNFLRRKFME